MSAAPPTILTRILEHKRDEVEARRRQRSQVQLESACRNAPPMRGFTAALQRAVAAGRPAVIAEVKKASPSRGVIRPSFDPVAIARAYALGGATCLSVLTDEAFFQGSDDCLVAARAAVDIPVLRKDFVVDPYQLFEARALGADCVLLIAAAMTPKQLDALYTLARGIDLDVLIEVHDAAELDIALAQQPPLIGINNRNLHSFETRLETTYELLGRIPAGTLVVTESGIHERAQVDAMRSRGVHAFLIGEAFMKASEPGKALTSLFFADSGS
jgi:indole-3-glycerol phosphate synthase